MRKNKVIFTIDYETWQPIPEGKDINWNRDLIAIPNELMDCFESVGVKLTFLVEICEIMYLEVTNPNIYEAIKTEIQSIIKRGHDVQLHMHPNWLPETGASYIDGEWVWDESLYAISDYPGDISELISRCKKKLEEIVSEVMPDYKVIAYRAGAYRIQPFKKIYRALVDNDIELDTSVYRGGISIERKYNFVFCKSRNNPYKASIRDAQISAKASKVVEYPIMTPSFGQRWIIDELYGKVFTKQFLNLSELYFNNECNYFVAVGHSKGEHYYDEIRKNLEVLSRIPGIEFDTFSGIIKELRNDTIVNKSELKICEVKSIMEEISKKIVLVEENSDRNIFSILLSARASKGEAAKILYWMLKQYGYKVARITVRAVCKSDKNTEHEEYVELTLNNKVYILDQSTNNIFEGTIDAKIDSFEVENAVAYEYKRKYEKKMGYNSETKIQAIIRSLNNVSEYYMPSFFHGRLKKIVK